MSELHQLQQLIQSELQKVKFPDTPSSLYDPVRYMLSLGGKRLRPTLVLLGCDIFKGDLQKAIHPALAVEVFHNFTLLHDDIMDNAPVRRGKQTVHEKWDTNIAILSGDAMFTKSFQLLMQTDAALIPALADVFNRTAMEVCEGQQLDMDFEKREVTIDEYLEMIRLKTAVLLGCALEMGAIIAGASKEDCAAIYKAGCDLGIAFQLQDDLLDLYGDEAAFGKMPGGDVVANKKTYLLLKALELADEKQTEEIHRIMHNGLKPEDKVQQMKSIFDQLGIKEKTLALMEQNYSEAMQLIHQLHTAEERKNTLIHLAESLRIRAN